MGELAHMPFVCTADSSSRTSGRPARAAATDMPLPRTDKDNKPKIINNPYKWKKNLNIRASNQRSHYCSCSSLPDSSWAEGQRSNHALEAMQRLVRFQVVAIGRSTGRGGTAARERERRPSALGRGRISADRATAGASESERRLDLSGTSPPSDLPARTSSPPSSHFHPQPSIGSRKGAWMEKNSGRGPRWPGKERRGRRPGEETTHLARCGAEVPPAGGGASWLDMQLRPRPCAVSPCCLLTRRRSFLVPALRRCSSLRATRGRRGRGGVGRPP